MGEVVQFKTKQAKTVPVDSGQANEQPVPHPTPQAPGVAGYLVLACLCGSSEVELLMGGVVQCARCNRRPAARWDYADRLPPSS